MSQQRYIMIRGEVFRWEEKEPFVVSGHSVHGAVEYSLVEDKLKCHDCGEWYQNLSGHTAHAHQSSRDFKIRHGLNITSPLIVPSLRAARKKCFASLSPEQRRANLQKARAAWTGEKNYAPKQLGEGINFNGTCLAQTILKLQALACDLGRTPTEDDAPKPLYYAVHNRFGSWNRGLIAAGIDVINVAKFGKPQLREILRDFYVLNKRLPKKSEYGTGRLPVDATYRRHYGSMAAAYADAGLALVGRKTIELEAKEQEAA